jgi:hypothetical protein
MSSLKDLVSKGVRLIVADGEAPPPIDDVEVAKPPAPPPASARPKPAREREIPAEAFSGPPPRKVVKSEVPATVSDFSAVYQEAGITLPAHGYGVDKVGEMLESKRLANLAKEVKATAILAALEAANVAIRDVIQDAVLRDKALDAFEAAKEREAQEARARNEARVASLNSQLQELMQKINAEIENLKHASDDATKAFQELLGRKRREEERLHAIVAHFIEGSDNPVTTSAPPAAAKPGPS